MVDFLRFLIYFFFQEIEGEGRMPDFLLSPVPAATNTHDCPTFVLCKIVLSSPFVGEGHSYYSVIISLIVPHEKCDWLPSFEYSFVA
jgi:hypothetical protein